MPNPGDFFTFAGPMIILIIVIYLAVMALAIFIGYLILKAAVRNGTIEAHRRLDEERRQREQWAQTPRNF